MIIPRTNEIREILVGPIVVTPVQFAGSLQVHEGVRVPGAVEVIEVPAERLLRLLHILRDTVPPSPVVTLSAPGQDTCPCRALPPEPPRTPRASAPVLIDRHGDALAPLPGAAPGYALALAAADAVKRRAEDTALAGLMTNDPYSPWHGADGWRLNGAAQHDFRYLDGDQERSVSVVATAQGFEFDVDGAALDLLSGDQGSVVVGDGEVIVFTSAAAYRLVDHDPVIMADSAVAGDGSLPAPMPGRVVAIMVDAGATVARGAALMVIEAMKMEHTIAAPTDGHVESFRYNPGDQVDEGAELMTFIADEGV